MAATLCAAVLCSCSSGPGTASVADDQESLQITGFGTVTLMGNAEPYTVTISGSPMHRVLAAMSSLKDTSFPNCEENVVVYRFHDVRSGKTIWSGSDLLCPIPGVLTFGPRHRSAANTCAFLREVASAFPAGRAEGSGWFLRPSVRSRANSFYNPCARRASSE